MSWRPISAIGLLAVLMMAAAVRPTSAAYFPTNAYATIANTSGTTPPVTCSATGGVNPSRDMIWQVLTSNTTYTTVPAAVGCLDGDIIEAHFIQADNQSYTVTIADGLGTAHVGPSLYAIPGATGAGQGYFLHFVLQYHKSCGPLPCWALIQQDTNPVLPMTGALIGAIDGTNRSFLLPVSPTRGAVVFVDGLAQQNTVDGTLSGNTWTFAVGNPPQPGSALTAAVF